MTTEERNQLVTENIALVKSRVHCLTKKVKGKDAAYDDLVQSGVIGLIKGIEHYNPNFGANLATYCIPWIDSEIREFTRKDRTIYFPYQLYYRILKYKTLMTEKNLSQEEIAKELDITKERSEFLFQLSNMLTTEYDSEMNTRDGRKGYNPELVYIRKETLKELESAINALPDIEKNVLCSAYGYKAETKTMRQLGRELNMSAQNVGNIRNRAVERLKKYMARFENEVV